MNRNTVQARIGHFLLPSADGIVCYIAISIVVWLTHNINAVRDYLYVPKQTDVVGSALSSTNDLLIHVLGVSRTDSFVLGTLWAVVGIVVYMFVDGIVKMARELQDDISIRHYVWPQGVDRNQPLQSFAVRLGVRLTAAVLLIVYLLNAISYATAWQLNGDIGWQHWLASNDVLAFSFLFVVSCLIWHGFVVLLRLMSLRDRLFTGR